MLESFSLEQLGVFIALTVGSLGGCIVMILKVTSQSRCSNIRFCCLTCTREVIKKQENEPLEV